MNSDILDILSVIGTWVASLGTVAAVITSLYLARAQNSIKVRVYADLRKMISNASKEMPDYLFVSVVNTGFRPVNIMNIGWESAKEKIEYKRYKYSTIVSRLKYRHF